MPSGNFLTAEIEFASQFSKPIISAWLPAKGTGSKESAEISLSSIAGYISRGFPCAASKLT